MTTHRSLILDVYGAYARPLSGWLAVADLVRLMGDLGQDHAAVRSAASRMKKAGFLAADTRGGAAGYSLTETALDVLRDGDERIFASSTPSGASTGWVLAVFSVPEHRRDRRHQLRSALGRLGFGQLAPGVWLAPARARVDAERVLRRADLTAYVTLFEGTVAGFEPTPTLVARTWDLEALAGRHVAFCAEHGPPLAAWRGRRRRSGPDRERLAFVAYTAALADWRRLVYLDPGLPTDLVPPRWPGRRSRRLFADIVTHVAPAATHHVESVVARGPAP